MNIKNFIKLASLLLALVACAAPAARAHQQQKQKQATAAKRAAKKSAGDFYSCPMHPNVRAQKKGRCPVCKMDLRLTHAEDSPSVEGAEEGAHAVNAPAESPKKALLPDSSKKMLLPDVELLDQDGRTVRFYSDLVKGKVVAINFIFTTCTTICPPLGATFARVQKELRAQPGGGGDVRLISISVDPATDTPERMKAWGAKFHAAEGWTFLTGAKPQVDEVLRALGAATASPSDHSPTVLIGNDATGQWTRTYGLASPTVLIKLIGDAAAGRLDSPAVGLPAKESEQK